jgi:DNA-binding transcriptional MerR regulator
MSVVAERLLNTEKAARALDVHPTTLRRWAKAGIVTSANRTAGGHARWDLDELRRQVAEHLEQRGDS